MTEQESQRRKKLKLLQEDLNEDPYSIDSVACNSSIKDIISSAEGNFIDENRGREYTFLGRVISNRESFLTVRYDNEDLQIYISSELQQVRDYFKKYVDLGDILYLKGTLFKTRIGVYTIRVFEVKIVSKCLNPITSLYYGINSDELKHKNRVGKSLSDKNFLDKFYFRFEFIKELRKYLYEEGYVEVETPILELVYGGANAVPFRTNCRALKKNFFLRIATEISLKKMIISGFPKVFEIGKVFRNEGIDSTHNPEFTSLEIYTVNANFQELIDLAKRIIMKMSDVMGVKEVNWNGHNISFSNFEERSISELVRKETEVDFYKDEISLEQALQLAQKYELKLMDYEKTVGCILHKLFDDLISPTLINPTFVYGFHKDVSPLSKKDPKNPNFTLRYELFIGGMEFANGFLELSDPDDQLDRFRQQEENRKLGNEEAFGIDDSFIFALKYGLPPTAGLGIGIDRLIMMFTESSSIKDILFFPIVSNK